MKKIIITVAVLLSISAGAVSFLLSRKHKMPLVSENVNIPLFVDNLMSQERYKLNAVAFDSSSDNSRLRNLGFSSKSGVALDNGSAKAIYKLYEVYDSIYPNHQFVNFNCVAQILEKYGLALGSAATFVCDVPKNQIDSMESFKASYLMSRGTWYPIHDLEISMKDYETLNMGYGGVSQYLSNTHYKITNGLGALSKDRDLAKYAKLDFEKREGVKSFLMIAPETCFIGPKNSNGTFGSLKDPIVLQPVEGGYIIVTAW